MTPVLPQQGYERFFGFNEPPFSLAPNPRFLFESGSHAAVLAQVAYALERREPLVVVTGEIGTGKTLLCRTVLERVERKTFVSVINDPLLEREDLLKHILQDFGVISRDRSKLAATSRHELIRALQEFLASLVPLQAHAVVIIDEAQQVQPQVLEQIRLLSNLDDQRGTMLQIMLVGQADLEPLLSRPELRQFEQRVSRRLRLEPLNAGEVEQYINHRAAVARGGSQTGERVGAGGSEATAGGLAETPSGPEFTRGGIDALAAISAGVPRVINILCDRALEAAYERLSRTIDRSLVEVAARELNMAVPEAPTGGSMWSLPERPDVPQQPPLPEVQEFPEIPAPVAAAAEPEPVPAVPSDETFSETEAAVSTLAASPSMGGQTKRHILAFVVSALVAAVATWFVARALSRPPQAPTRPPAPTGAASRRPTSAAPAPQPSVPPAGAVPTPAPVAPNSSTSSPTAPAAQKPPPPTSPDQGRASSAAAPTAGSEQFNIVVASFRTEARATSVASDVKALGLPVRLRAAGGWQQVLAGPFASRTIADDAQRRLGAVGLGGTQIITASR